MSAATSLALALLVGCGADVGPVRLSARDDGRLVEVARRDMIEVRLESNPSTGFAWTFVRRPDAGVLHLVSSQFVPADGSDKPLVGRGGTEVWRFEAIAAGTTSFRLSYARPGQPEGAEAVFGVRVRVK